MVGELTTITRPRQPTGWRGTWSFRFGDSRFPKLLAPPAQRGAVSIVPIDPKRTLAFFGGRNGNQDVRHWFHELKFGIYACPHGSATRAVRCCEKRQGKS